MRALKTMTGISVCLFLLISGASAQTYIGILLDGYQKDCKVQSKGEEFPCDERRQLYQGDKIIKLPNVRSLKIKWAPYASGKELDAKTLFVAFEPPENKKGVLENVKEMVGFVKTKHSVTLGATRGDPYEPRILQPGKNVTVIPGKKITFAVGSEMGKFIVFKDNSGKEVYRQDLKGTSSIQLTPEEIGIRPSEIYTWTLSGTRRGRQFILRLLSDKIFNQIAADLKEIDEEKQTGVEKAIQKATYLQFMSDSYPKEIDLYWLSYQLLEETKNKGSLKEDDKILVQELTKNYLKHDLETR